MAEVVGLALLRTLLSEEGGSDCHRRESGGVMGEERVKLREARAALVFWMHESN
jgi:hypothetical protein